MSIEEQVNMPEDFLPTREGDGLGRANYYVQRLEYPERGRVSDGYHSFDELYTHRIHVYIALCKSIWRDPAGPLVWISKKHSDGTEWKGWFLLGIGVKPGEQITYHLPEKYWAECARFAEVVNQAFPFDGHTSEDVLIRLLSL